MNQPTKKALAADVLSMDPSSSWQLILLEYYGRTYGYGTVNSLDDLFAHCWCKMLVMPATTDVRSIAEVALDRGAHRCGAIEDGLNVHRCDGLGLMSNDFRDLDDSELAEIVEAWKKAYKVGSQSWLSQFSAVQNEIRTERTRFAA